MVSVAVLFALNSILLGVIFITVFLFILALLGLYRLLLVLGCRETAF